MMNKEILNSSLVISHSSFTNMFSRLYGAAANFRNSLYERGVFKSVSLGVPVISVGNITVGGTGKTPLVALVAEQLFAKGERVGILTRGYGRENPKARVLVADGARITADAPQAGDEPFELARKLVGKAVIIADADRAAAGIWARKKFGITTFVLDDAFQHRRVERDMNIVLIDATNPFGNGKTLPFGILREPLENLQRADKIIITRANLASNINDLKTEISKYNSHCPIFVSKNRISKLTELKDFHAVPVAAKFLKTISEKCFAFCALGNPNNFYDQLRQENFNLTATESFADHHFYTTSDIAEISAKARKAGAKVLLTTAKDAVKLQDFNFEIPCFVVETEMIFDQEFQI